MRNFHTIVHHTGPDQPWVRPKQNLAYTQTQNIRQMSCDVVFGSPSADCMGTGVCRITARTGNSPTAIQRARSCRSTVGLLFPIEGGNGVSLILTRTLLCVRLYRLHVRHGTLTLENPCPLPKDIIQQLGLKINELSIGKYPIQEAEGFLRMDFKTD